MDVSLSASEVSGAPNALAQPRSPGTHHHPGDTPALQLVTMQLTTAHANKTRDMRIRWAAVSHPGTVIQLSYSFCYQTCGASPLLL